MSSRKKQEKSKTTRWPWKLLRIISYTYIGAAFLIVVKSFCCQTLFWEPECPHRDPKWILKNPFHSCLYFVDVISTSRLRVSVRMFPLILIFFLMVNQKMEMKSLAWVWNLPDIWAMAIGQGRLLLYVQEVFAHLNSYFLHGKG